MIFQADKKSNKGFAAIFISVLILIIVLSIGMSIAGSTVAEQRILNNITKGSQAYYASESGIEDALLRLSVGKKWTSVCGMKVENAWVTTTISSIVGGSRTITSAGSISNNTRKTQVSYEVSSDSVFFFYGAQAGDGGITLLNNAKIHGNLFSNGDVMGSNNSVIDNDVIVSGHHQINNGDIGGNATVYNCVDADIGGKLTYINSNTCDVEGATEHQAEEIDSVSLPIPQSQIDEWKNEATAGGTSTNNIIISGTQSLGPIQIGTLAAPKTLTVNDTLNIMGTIYVTGDVVFNGTTRLDSSYSSLSGIIIVDGKVNVENGAILSGSGEQGSYIMVLSTNNSLDPSDPAIYVKNNAGGSVFYTTSGLIYLKNKMTAREITGYKIQIDENAEIFYESGLSDLRFTGGPGGGWQVSSWKEIE